MQLLKPEFRPGLAVQLGVGSLDDLPRYEIDQTLDDASGAFLGEATLTYTNLTGSRLAALPLLLHPNAAAELGAVPGAAGALTVDAVSVTTGPAATLVPRRPTFVEVRFTRPLAPGERVVVRVSYHGRLRVLDGRVNDVFAQALASMGTLAGNGAADYGLLAVGDGLVTVASAYPMIPCWRDGGFDTGPPARLGDLAYNGVAAFRVRTVLPPGMRVVTNLVDAAPRAAPGGGVIVHSEGVGVRDFVLVAGRDLEHAETTLGRTRIASWFRARDARAGRAALLAARAALHSFERRFGPYPYAELDLVEASLTGGAGGVEFSALVLVAGMLYRSPEDSQSPLKMLLDMWARLGQGLGALGGKGGRSRTRAPAADGDLAALTEAQLEFTVYHEVAHQYFAGIVGNDSRRHPALDEPLAQYLAALAHADRHGARAGAKALDLNAKLNYALYRLLGGPDRAVARDTGSFRSALEYAALVYGKAPYLYVALERRLGAPRLHAAMRATVSRYRFGMMTTAQWVDALVRGTGDPGVESLCRRWLAETHGDQDLQVDATGDYVLTVLFPPEVRDALRQAAPALGLRPGDLLRMVFGGALVDDAPVGPPLDPQDALRRLRALPRGGGR